MRGLIPFLIACFSAALVPWMSNIACPEAGILEAAHGPATSWPTRWEGRPLRPLPSTPQEGKFAGAFPGAMARFTDGSQEILFRRADMPTRKLHPGSDCLRAWGYVIQPLPAQTGTDGRTWSCLRATRKGESLEVREMVVAGNGSIEAGPFSAGAVESWTDVSSWYWNAFWGRSHGPWTAITVSRRL